MARKALATLLAVVLGQPTLAADGEHGQAQYGSPAASSVSLLGPGLRVSDLDAAVRFYRDGLGLTVNTRIPLGGELEEVILGFGRNQAPPFLLLVGPKPGSAQPKAEATASSGRIVLAVTDLRTLHDRLAAAGYDPEKITVHEASGTTLFWVTDPDGHRLEIIQPSVSTDMDGQGHGDHHG